MKEKQRAKVNNHQTEHPDFYEAAYQKIRNKIALEHKGICPSELRRMALAEIRHRLKLHIPLEDIDMYNYYEWPVEKRWQWLSDLHMFVSKTLGKRTIKKLWGF